jgi:hypothetical protein
MKLEDDGAIEPGRSSAYRTQTSRLDWTYDLHIVDSADMYGNIAVPTCYITVRLTSGRSAEL